MHKLARAAAAGLPIALAGLAVARARRHRPPLVPYHGARHRVLVLGGGFGGFGAASEIARRAPEGTSVLVVDRQDFLTFWPMVPEVIPAAIELQHALRPLPRELVAAGVNFLRAEVEKIDLDARKVTTSAGELNYDALVVALGWRTSFFGVAGASEHCLTMDTAGDAVRIRDRVLAQLEQASAAANQANPVDANLLNFAVVGGGSTGVEVAANIRALLDEVLPEYPAVDPREVCVHLLQAAGAVLPHLDADLQRVAQARLQAEQIAVRTGAEVKSVDPGGVQLSDGSRLDALTVVWTAGVEPNPIARKIGGARTDRRGRLLVDDCLRLSGHRGAYALGDVAAVESDGKPVPPTAQAAVQEAECVAANLVADLAGGRPQPFRFHYMGQLVELGGRFAVSQVMGRRLSGALAHLLWRAIYLYKLGDAHDRARVAGDWVFDALLGRRVSRLPVA